MNLHTRRGLRQRAALFGAGYDFQAVAEPLHRGAGNEDRTFERITAYAAELIGDGGEQPVLGGNRGRAGVENDETAGAVR